MLPPRMPPTRKTCDCSAWTTSQHHRIIVPGLTSRTRGHLIVKSQPGTSPVSGGCHAFPHAFLTWKSGRPSRTHSQWSSSRYYFVRERRGSTQTGQLFALSASTLSLRFVTFLSCTVHDAVSNCVRRLGPHCGLTSSSKKSSNSAVSSFG